MALFATGRSQQSQSRYLVEFRAGKMHMRDRMVHADKRKGTVYIHQSEDMLMHFCWKDRSTGDVEDDLIIFPDDVEFIPVPQCTTGRVFLLKFKNSNRKLFFWMQEPKSDKDDEFCRKVNETLNNPPVPGSRSSAGSGSAELGRSLGIGDGDLQALGGMDQQQLMQFLNLMGGSGSGGGGGGLDPSALMGGLEQLGARVSAASTSSTSTPSRASAPTTTAPTTATTTTGASAATTTTTTAASTPTSRPAIQLADLQNILSGMNIPAEGQLQQDAGPGLDLEDVLTAPEARESAETESHQSRLLAHLPEHELISRDVEELRTTLRSPQFRQASGMFGSALQTGQLGPALRQFGLSSPAVQAANRGDVETLAEQLESESEAAEAEADGEKKADTEDMDLD